MKLLAVVRDLILITLGVVTIIGLIAFAMDWIRIG
jgi:hypothetical protein